MKKSALLALAVALAACGGKIDGEDGGTGGPGGNDSGISGLDAVAKKDAVALPESGTNPGCSPLTGTTNVSSNGTCSVNTSWTCGDTSYEVDCDCPSAQCTCSAQSPNTGSGTTVPAGSVCPSCSGDLPTLCGFPH